jgi:hypothetical protein
VQIDDKRGEVEHVLEFSWLLVRRTKEKTLQLQSAFSASAPDAKDDELLAELAINR